MSAVIDYDTSKRHQATKTGQRIRKMAHTFFPTSLIDPIVATAGKGQHLIVANENRRLTIDDVKKSLYPASAYRYDTGRVDALETYRPLVIGDTSDYRRLLTLVKSDTKLARVVRAAKTIKAHRLTVYTTAMAELFYAPKATMTLDDWLDGDTLYARVISDILNNLDGPGYFLSALREGRAKSVDGVLTGMYFNSNTSMSSGYTAANCLVAQTNALIALDPVARDRAVLSGAANTLEATSMPGLFYVSTPLTLKRGTSVLALTPDNKIVSDTIEDIRISADGRTTVVLPAFARRATEGIMTGRPFVRPAPRIENFRWYKGAKHRVETEPIVRTVPAHIALAAQRPKE